MNVPRNVILSLFLLYLARDMWITLDIIVFLFNIVLCL